MTGATGPQHVSTIVIFHTLLCPAQVKALEQDLVANLSSAELVTHSDSPRRRPRRTSG
jgi:hypothetical protein